MAGSININYGYEQKNACLYNFNVVKLNTLFEDTASGWPLTERKAHGCLKQELKT